MKMHSHNRNTKGVWTRRDYLIFALVLIGLGSALAAMIIGPDIYRNHRLSRFDKETFVRIDEIESLRQKAIYSTDVTTHAYEVKYRYVVGGILYEKSEVISTIPDNRELMKAIRGEHGEVVFRYESSNPKKGLLSVKESH